MTRETNDLETPADRATSIETELGRRTDRAALCVETIAAMARRYADLLDGRFDAILSAWRALSPSLPSSWVEWDTAAGVMRGRAEDIDETGALLVRTGGRIQRVIAGELRWL